MLTNEQLELAAVAAETWADRTSSRCATSHFGKPRAGQKAIPAPEAAASGIQPTNGHLSLKDLQVVSDMMEELWNLFPNYSATIDCGLGDSVAERFRHEKRGVLFHE